MEGQTHFYGRAEVQWKGKSTYIEMKYSFYGRANFIKWHYFKEIEMNTWSVELLYKK